MTWDAAVTAGMDQIREDHGLAEVAKESERYAQARLSFGVSFKQGYRQGWWDAIGWLLNEQMHIDDLTALEMVIELGKESGSIYWPVKVVDPKFWADCPGCHQQRLFDKRGRCDDCGWVMS